MKQVIFTVGMVLSLISILLVRALYGISPPMASMVKIPVEIASIFIGIMILCLTSRFMSLFSNDREQRDDAVSFFKMLHIIPFVPLIIDWIAGGIIRKLPLGSIYFCVYILITFSIAV